MQICTVSRDLSSFSNILNLYIQYSELSDHLPFSHKWQCKMVKKETRISPTQKSRSELHRRSLSRPTFCTYPRRYHYRHLHGYWHPYLFVVASYVEFYWRIWIWQEWQNRVFKWTTTFHNAAMSQAKKTNVDLNWLKKRKPKKQKKRKEACTTEKIKLRGNLGTKFTCCKSKRYLFLYLLKHHCNSIVTLAL